MVTQQVLFVFVAMCLIKTSVEECQMPARTPPPESELIDLQLWKEYYEQLETCVDETKNIRKQNSPTTDGLVADLWGHYVKSPINEMITYVPCKKKSFDKILRNSAVEKVRTGLGKILVIDGQMENFWNLMTGNLEELKDEIWKANQTILCALSMNTAEIREMLKDQTTPIDGMVNNQPVQIKDFVNMIAEDLKNATKDFQLNMNKRFDELSADKAVLSVKLTNISERLDKTYLPAGAFFSINELYGLYKLSIENLSLNQYTERCGNEQMTPIEALRSLVTELQSEHEMFYLLQADHFSDETYNGFYKTIIHYFCDAVELLFNCPDVVTYEHKINESDEMLAELETALDIVNEKRKKRMQIIA